MEENKRQTMREADDVRFVVGAPIGHQYLRNHVYVTGTVRFEGVEHDV